MRKFQSESLVSSTLSRSEWEAYDRRFPAPTFFARPMWAAAIEKALPYCIVQPLQLDDAFIPAVRIRNGRLSPWQEFRAMPLGSYSMVLSRDGGPVEAARAADALKHVIATGIDSLEWTPWPLAQFEIAPGLDVERVPHETAIIDLRQGAEAALARFKGVSRRMVGQSERRGVTCAPHGDAASIDVYYEMILESTRRWGLSAPPFSKDLLQAILHFGGADAELWLVHSDGEPIAGGVVMYGSQELFFWSAVMRTEFAALRPSNALNAALIRAAVERGMSWYNLGASEGLPSVAKFKASLGAEPYEYTTLRYRSPKLAAYTRLRTSLVRRFSTPPGTSPDSN